MDYWDPVWGVHFIASIFHLVLFRHFFSSSPVLLELGVMEVLPLSETGHKARGFQARLKAQGFLWSPFKAKVSTFIRPFPNPSSQQIHQIKEAALQ